MAEQSGGLVGAAPQGPGSSDPMHPVRTLHSPAGTQHTQWQMCVGVWPGGVSLCLETVNSKVLGVCLSVAVWVAVLVCVCVAGRLGVG